MSKKLAVHELTLIALFIALTAVFAQIAIPIPFSPVPISFGLVAVYMTGIFLKPHHAVLAQICYLLLGAVGLPVFGNFHGGLSALFGPTGGYLMVYPLMAALVAFVLNGKHSLEAESRQSKKFLFAKASIALIVAHAILYLGGTLWFSIITGNSFAQSLVLTAYPYIPLDAVKIVFCLSALVPLRSRFISMNLLTFKNPSKKVTQRESCNNGRSL